MQPAWMMILASAYYCFVFNCNEMPLSTQCEFLGIVLLWTWCGASVSPHLVSDVANSALPVAS